jgi:hypothetical protein
MKVDHIAYHQQETQEQSLSLGVSEKMSKIGATSVNSYAFTLAGTS